MEIPDYIRGLNHNIDDEILNRIIDWLPYPNTYEGNEYRVIVADLEVIPSVLPKVSSIPDKNSIPHNGVLFRKRYLTNGDVVWNAEDVIKI